MLEIFGRRRPRSPGVVLLLQKPFPMLELHWALCNVELASKVCIVHNSGIRRGQIRVYFCCLSVSIAGRRHKQSHKPRSPGHVLMAAA